MYTHTGKTTTRENTRRLKAMQKINKWSKLARALIRILNVNLPMNGTASIFCFISVAYVNFDTFVCSPLRFVLFLLCGFVNSFQATSVWWIPDCAIYAHKNSSLRKGLSCYWRKSTSTGAGHIWYTENIGIKQMHRKVKMPAIYNEKTLYNIDLSKHSWRSHISTY